MSHTKITGMLNALQEGVIDELNFSEGDLNARIDCGYLAGMLSGNFRYFYCVFKGVEDYYFQPWDDEEISCREVEDIRLFKPSIISIEMIADDYLKIYSNCENVYTGGNFYIKASDIRVFDEELNELSLENLSELSDKYWYSENNAEG